ncbi:unnamed protein product, partial [marine sediment metagenome]
GIYFLTVDHEGNVKRFEGAHIDRMINFMEDFQEET